MARPIAISASETEDYILEANRSDPPEEQVVFRICRSLPFGVRRRILDAMATNGETLTPAVGTRYILACKFGLRGWSNLEDETGAPAKFVRVAGEVSDDSLSMLDDADLIELGQTILSRAKLSVEQVEK